MLKSGRFWILWSLFALSGFAGGMVVGNIKPFGISSGLDAQTAGTAVGILALFNGAGRIAWGWISDRLGRKNSMMLLFSLQGVVMLILAKATITPIILMVGVAWVGFYFGGYFALFPSATADYFGTKNLGVNYGFMITAFAVAGTTGPILGGYVYDCLGSYMYAFLAASLLCWIASFIVLVWKISVQRSKSIALSS